MSTPTTDTQVERPPIGRDVGNWGATAGGTSGVYSKALTDSLSVLMAPTGGLTAARVRAMRRDYQVSACLLVLTLPFLGVTAVVESEDPEQGEALTEAWNQISADVMRSSARALWAGYSPNTLRWDFDADLRLLTVTKIRDLEPSTCKPLTQPDGSFSGIVQDEGLPSKVIIDNPLECLWLTEGMESGNLYGRSLLQAALEPWQQKLLERVWHARTLERYGEPTLVVRHPVNLVQTEASKQAQAAAAAAGEDLPPLEVEDSNRADALKLGEDQRHHSTFALPSDQHVDASGKSLGYKWSADYLEATAGDGASFREAIDANDRAIARALFIPDLLFSNSDSGAYALGREHRSIFDASTEGRLADAGRQITRHLIDRIRVLNFGPDSPRARLRFEGVTDVDRDRQWAMAQTLVQNGRLPVDVEQIAADLGIPLLAPEEDDPDAAPDLAASPFANVGLPALIAANVISPAEARALLNIAGDPPPIPDPTAGGAFSAGQREEIRASLGLAPAPAGYVHLALPAYQQPQAIDPPRYRREFTPREKRIGLAALESGLNAAEATAIAGLTEGLEGARERVLRQIRGILAKGTIAEQIEAIGTLDLGALGSKQAGLWTTLLRDAWTLGLTSVVAQLTGVVDTEKIPTTLGPEARAVASVTATNAAERAASALATAIRAEVLNAVRSNVSAAGIAAVVSTIFDREITSEAKPARLTSRLLASQGLNGGRQDAVTRGQIRVRGAQYSAILDRTTCDLCERQDEMVIGIEHTDFARFTAPLHHSCRCTWVFITDQEEDFTATWTSPPNSLVDSYGGLIF